LFLAIVRPRCHPNWGPSFIIYTWEKKTLTNKDIQALVLFDDDQNTVKVELSNFVDKAEAIATANLIIAALGIAQVQPIKISETLH
tara:strand:- start:7630 stop:7887 length:258 start_codon:yes stop_codon:yes gene_type:complete